MHTKNSNAMNWCQEDRIYLSMSQTQQFYYLTIFLLRQRWMTAVDILVLWKMMICLILGKEADICDGLHFKMMVLTILRVNSQYLLLPSIGNNTIPATTVMV